jgi:hypothetical protein
MKRLTHFLSIIICSIIVAGNHTSLFAQDSTVSIVNRGHYYEVVLDFTSGVSHYEMGQLFMQKVLIIVPNFEQLLDSYLAEVIGSQSNYMIMLNRMADIKPQIIQEYQDEIDGMASQLSGGSVNTMGDGKLSKNEFYVLQLLTDVYRSTQCSGISVYGSQSATGNTMTARILDWGDGSKHQLAQIQSVTFIKNGRKSICTIGYLSFTGIITGFNDHGVFAGILDSPSGAAYSSSSKRSYILDLRYALENDTTLTDVAGYVADTLRQYTYNHLILLSDKHTSKVLENNFSGTGTNIRRALRSDTSSLNPGITWGFTNAIATVNSFLLSGNYNNHTGVPANTQRWSSIKTQLQLCGGTVTFNDLKQIASFDNGGTPQSQLSGDIYNSATQQIVLFQPDIFHLEVAFKPKSGILPTNPIFEEIPVSFNSNPAFVAKNNSILPESFMLEQNYPNPFNPSTTIRFGLPNRSTVKFSLYNILGQQVALLLNKELSAGYQEITWNANVASGIYFYRLEAISQENLNKHFVETKKMLLLR